MGDQLKDDKFLDAEDAQILSLIRNKQSREQGYQKLIAKFSARVYWQVRRMVYDHDDADDLTQEVFIKVFENIESFSRAAKLSTWIYRIAYNHTINFLKYKKRHSADNYPDFEQSVLNKLPSDTLFEADKITLALQKAILSLPAKQRAVFQMRYYDELPFAEISQITKTSEGALKASYHIAAEKVRDFVKTYAGLQTDLSK